MGELFRSGFVLQAAALHGDYVTPSLMGNGERTYREQHRHALVRISSARSNDQVQRRPRRAS